MSYCVNCGVELDESAEKCALCSTPVINPAKPQKQQVQTPFSSEEHIPEGIKKQFVAYVISMVFLIPNIVCFLVNLVFTRQEFWALYVNTTSFLVWIMFVFPFCTKRFKPYLMWFLDTIAVCAYVYFFFAMGYEKQIAAWFYNCALPIILTASAMVLFYMLWAKSKKRHWGLCLIAIISGIALLAMVAGALLDFSAGIKPAFEIAIIIFVCCAALIAFLAYCYTSRRMRSWLSKRFFV